MLNSNSGFAVMQGGGDQIHLLPYQCPQSMVQAHNSTWVILMQFKLGKPWSNYWKWLMKNPRERVTRIFVIQISFPTPQAVTLDHPCGSHVNHLCWKNQAQQISLNYKLGKPGMLNLESGCIKMCLINTWLYSWGIGRDSFCWKDQKTQVNMV